MKQLEKLYLFPFLILVSGIFLIYHVDKRIERVEMEKRNVQIKKECNVVKAEFQRGIDKLSILTSGVRSYIEINQGITEKEQLQYFLKKQFDHLLLDDSLVISFVDSNHIFQYSITPNTLSPNKLKGTSVKSIRNKEEIARLDKLMLSDDFQLFPPINMVEGYVGIPLNFRVIHENKVQGYIAALINFKSIIEPLYENSISTDKYVYNFSTNEGVAFDRFGYYDGSKIYNTYKDPASYKHSENQDLDFEYTSFSNFGYKFQIGVSYKKPYERSVILIGLFFFWLIALVCVTLILTSFLRKKIVKNDQLLELKGQELDTTNEELANFKHISSHDLKEPLRSLSSFSNLLINQYKDKLDNNAITYLNYINSSAIQMNHIFDDLTKYTNLIDHKRISKRQINLNQITANIKQSFAPVIKERNIKIDFDLLPTIYSNPHWMQQLFYHLISNAIKFNDKPSPEIYVGVKDVENLSVFFVRDNGIGIPEEYHKKVFSLFQRLSKKKEGTGTGLAICKKIIQEHQGKIWIDSEKGGSTTFYFTLPDFTTVIAAKIQVA